MTCDKCQHFEILYGPRRNNGVVWDLGRAHCKKHDLIVDFANHGKFKRLECPDKEVKMEGCSGMTNGDKIRQMADMELAMFLASLNCADCPVAKDAICTNNATGTCEDFMLTWVKQEAKE